MFQAVKLQALRRAEVRWKLSYIALSGRDNDAASNMSVDVTDNVAYRSQGAIYSFWSQ